MSLGNILKDTREERGFTLDYIQEVTKIQKRFLQAIEEDRLDRLPGEFYARVFIRQYAEAVGLNADELLAAHQEVAPAADLEEDLKSVSHEPSIDMSSNESKVLKFLPKIIVLLFVAVGIFLIWYFYNSYNPTNSSNPNSQQPDLTLEEPDKTTDKDDQKPKDSNDEKPDKKPESEPAPKQTITEISAQGNTFVFELENAETFKVKLVSTGGPWVSINAANSGSLYTGTLTNAEEKEFDLTGKDEQVTIVTGRAHQTKLFINDEEIPLSPDFPSTQTITVNYIK